MAFFLRRIPHSHQGEAMTGTDASPTPALLRTRATKALALAASTTDDRTQRALRQLAAELEAEAKAREAIDGNSSDLNSKCG